MTPRSDKRGASGATVPDAGPTPAGRRAAGSSSSSGSIAWTSRIRPAAAIPAWSCVTFIVSPVTGSTIWNA